MTKPCRWWKLLVLTAAALFVALLSGCMQESDLHEPQRMPENGPGPGGTSAFISGEASKTGLKPVKEGARVTDAGAADAAGQTDTVIAKEVESAPETSGPSFDDIQF